MKRRRHSHNQEKKKKKKNKEDRVSDLPECIQLHILSFLDPKEAVQTCILSTPWKNLWKSLSILKFTSSKHYKRNLKGFTKFVSNILTLRNDTTPLHTLEFHSHGAMEPYILKRILKYAFSHNVQQLQIDVNSDIPQLPPSFFSCHTLTSLKLSLDRFGSFPNSLNFPALTDLLLHKFVFVGRADDGRVEPFSALNKLNSLVIEGCIVRDKHNLCISSATLTNLTIHTTFYWGAFKFELCTPSLCNFVYSGVPVQKLCGSMCNLCSIKHVNIGVHVLRESNSADTPLVIFNWLIELANIESLMVSSNTLQVLSSVPDLLKLEFPSLYKLKSLKVRRPYLCSSSIPEEIVDFLLQNAPSAKVDIVP